MAKNPQPDPKIKFADEPVPASVTERQAIDAPHAEKPADPAPKTKVKVGEGATVLELPTSERNRANQEAAKKVVESLKGVDIDRDFPRPRVKVEPITEAEAKKLQPRRYRILARHELARGASKVVLPAGKVISENDYDIADLKFQGVQLREETGD